MAQRVRFLMIGGFLGAGKTTAIARLTQRLIERGQRVAVVTNDQAYDLVDTMSLRARGLTVGEVPGACFCCKFDDLVDIASRLADSEQPDVILGEPVGSCTDLVATVIEPLRHLYGEQFETGPFSVLLKPEHGRKILGDQPGAGFSPKAAYIFLKQIEEADLVVLNKIDKLSPAERAELIDLVAARYPGKEIMAISARHGEGIDELLAALDRPEPTHTTPQIDYDVYAEGEAELGWLNATVSLSAGAGGELALDDVARDLVERLRLACAQAGAEPAHLKVLASHGPEQSIANLVSSGEEVELSLSSAARVARCELTINARVAVDPEVLAALVEAELAALAASSALESTIERMQHFRPGRPVPTHRMPIEAR